MTTDEQVSERIEREARVAGLRDFRTPSLEAVERRRLQLWILTAVLLVSISLGVVFVSTWQTSATRFVRCRRRSCGSPSCCSSIAFCAYAIEKERHLRKLSRLLIDERVLTTALSEPPPRGRAAARRRQGDERRYSSSPSSSNTMLRQRRGAPRQRQRLGDAAGGRRAGRGLRARATSTPTAGRSASARASPVTSRRHGRRCSSRARPNPSDFPGLVPHKCRGERDQRAADPSRRAARRAERELRRRSGLHGVRPARGLAVRRAGGRGDRERASLRGRARAGRGADAPEPDEERVRRAREPRAADADRVDHRRGVDPRGSRSCRTIAASSKTSSNAPPCGSGHGRGPARRRRARAGGGRQPAGARGPREGRPRGGGRPQRARS